MIDLLGPLAIFDFMLIAAGTIFVLHANGMRPALVYFFAVYIPLQNLVIPIATVLLEIPPTLVFPLLALKDFLLLIALAGLVVSVRPIRLRTADLIGLLFLALMLANAAASPSDLTSAILGMRSYAIPIALYFLGRLSLATDAQIRHLIRFVLVVGVAVALFSLGEYALSIYGLSPLDRLWDGYFEAVYGHGRPVTEFLTPGFGGVKAMVGPFGNNLILSSFLRFVLCLFLFYLVQYRERTTSKDLCFAGLIVLGSVLTLSRYGLAALIAIVVVLVLSRRPLSRPQKALSVAALTVCLVVAAPTLGTVLTTTTRIEDESTHAHVESLRELAVMEITWLGHGLGTGVHSSRARTTDPLSEGEGLLRQGVPEIGVVGISLFVLFVAAVIGRLLRRPGTVRERAFAADFRGWIAAPLIFELFRIPLDIAIRSFLGTGLAWFFAGYFYARDAKPDTEAGRGA